LITKRDVQLGKIALRAGMVTKEQLAKSIAIQKKLEKKVGLGAIWLKKGFVTKEQLEELVQLHNTEKTPENGTATGEKKPKKKKKKKAEDEASAADSESTPEKKPSDEAEKPKDEKSKDEKKDESAKRKSQKIEKSKSADPSTSESEVDSKLFESAPSSDGEEEDATRRVIACGECSKKYRVKKRQVGKRFKCRNCGERVRVPKDLFDASGKSDKAKPKPSGSVKEFALESSSDSAEVAAPAAAPTKTDAPKDSKKTSAVRTPELGKSDAAKSGLQKKPDAKGKSGAIAPAPAAPPKDPTSIAELAKLAAQRQAQPIAPKLSGKKLAGLYIQAAVLLILAASIGGAIYYFFVWKPAQDALAAHETAVQEERDRFLGTYDGAVKSSRDALEKAKSVAAAPTLDVVRELTTAISDLEVARRSVLALKPGSNIAPTIFQQENVTFALKRDEETKGETLYRDLVLSRGSLQLGLGGQKFVGDSARDFQTLLAQDPKCAPALALLGRAELARHHFAAAAESLRRALAIDPDPKTRVWLGAACDAGDLTSDAAQAFDALAEKEPLAKVLKARALFDGAEIDNALSEATDAASKLGNDGEPLGAAQALRGLILERKGDQDGSDKAFDACVTAGGESGRGLVARGEHRLRTGRFDEAAKDFDAAIKLAGGARAALGLGDAKAGLLDGDGARTARLQAASLAPRRSSALVAGEIDAFDDFRSPDPRAIAYRRMGEAAFGASRFDEARADFQRAIELDSFDAESTAALARAEIALKDLGSAETHMRTARALLASANDRGNPGEIPPLVRGPASARVLLAEAVFWDARGDLKAAEKSVDDAVSADSLTAGATAASLKGQILRKRGENTRARAEFLKALDLEETAKDAATTFYNRAKSQFAAAAKSGDPAVLEKTRGALDAALTLAPSHAHALCLRGRLSAVAKKWDQALADLGAAIDLNPWFRDAYVARGFLYIRDLPDDRRDELMPAKAETDFEFAIHIDDTHADAFFGRAYARSRRNETAQTLEDLEKAIQLDPSYALAYKLRGEVNRLSGKAAAAADDQKKYEELRKKGDEN
jgi:tetratricopeptide (TPR) repeat protein